MVEKRIIKKRNIETDFKKKKKIESMTYCTITIEVK